MDLYIINRKFAGLILSVMNPQKATLILSIILLACSDKSEAVFKQGETAYNEGKYEEARAFFLQVDSLGNQWPIAKKFLTKIDSINGIGSEFGGGFVNLPLDSTQYQLINFTCALFIDTPEERRLAEGNNSEAQEQDTLAPLPVDTVEAGYEEDVAADDGMWYTYLYERQFDTLKALKIPMVRVSAKPYIRFVNTSGKTWTVDKDAYFQDHNLAVFKLGKDPVYINLTDFSPKEIGLYFKE